MDKELIKKVQEKQMEIMDEIHRVCVENNLKYYLIGGSCLGAIRHKGFIPWDVDIDIAMPREDYELFFNKYYTFLSPKYSVHTYLTDEAFDKSHALVCLNNSVLLTKADLYDNSVPKFGIFVDVMPLDICPDNEVLQRKHKIDYLMVKKLRKLKMIRIYKSNGFMSRIVKHLLRFVFSPISVKKINIWQQKVMMRYRAQESYRYICSMASHFKYEKQLMKKEVYGEPVLVKFDSREYFIPQDYEYYLRRLYGDYMKLPSEEVQNKMYNYFEVAKWED